VLKKITLVGPGTVRPKLRQNQTSVAVVITCTRF